jgi:hypothetical protein
VEPVSAIPARRFAGQPGRDVIWAVFWANAVAILVLWWAGSGHDGVKTGADALNVIGRVTALLGTYLVLWELVLMARVSWLDDASGWRGSSSCTGATTAAFAMRERAIAYLETIPGYEAYAIGPDLRATWTGGLDSRCA